MAQALVPIIILFAVLGLAIWSYGKKMTTKIFMPPVIPGEGIRIPLINAYQGSLFFNVHSSLLASLILFEDHFEFRVLTKKSFNFGDVKQVDASSGLWGGGTGMLISFNNGAWNFRAFMNKHNLHEVLIYFKAKGCALTPKAEEFLNQPV